MMKDLSQADYRALAEFRYQVRRFLNFSEQAVRKAGVEKQQYQLMLAIKGIPDGVRPRIRELAERMQLEHHSTVELINRLESNGCVRRERSGDDRREVLLGLTAKGERILGELALHHREQLLSTGPDLLAALQLVQVQKRSREENSKTSKKRR
jgi:DNA-binding MarR family transcriptional regulator